MTIREAAAALGAEIVQNEFVDTKVTNVYTSDILSDVMVNAGEGGLLITVQAHRNTVAVASLMNIAAIVICNSRLPPENMLEAAKDAGIAVLLTGENQFTVSGKLYRLLEGQD